MASLKEAQSRVIIKTIRHAAGEKWKVLVVDTESKGLIYNAVKEEEILNENVPFVEEIEKRRHTNTTIYGATKISQRLFSLDIKDPWSFPTLFHNECGDLVKRHLIELSQKIVSVCVSLGEYPLIRYYRPANASHDASVLSAHLAHFVQGNLDNYAQHHTDYPPPSNRPRGILYIADRSMDVIAPLVHEFTYQAMAHDLLPVREGDKVMYKTTVNGSEQNMELSEEDMIWLKYRHMHMKDVLGNLVEDFKKFRVENSQFDNENSTGASVHVIKDMLAGLKDYQKGKDTYSLHLNMAEECMDFFSSHKLNDVAGVEQTLATGLDESYKKPKHVAEDLVNLLDMDEVVPPDRLRLITLYALYRNGILVSDIEKLLEHSGLPNGSKNAMLMLRNIGRRATKQLGEPESLPPQVFPQKAVPATINEENALSRFETNLKLMLEEQNRGTLDPNIFPYTKPHLDPDGTLGQESMAQSSLRSSKPTWARSRPSAGEPRQRIIVFMAGGATYSELRTCYEMTKSTSKDIYLATSHMLTPKLYMRQLSDLAVHRGKLNLPVDAPKPQAPAYLFEADLPTQPSRGPSAPPPTTAMANMNISQSQGPHPDLPASPQPEKSSKKPKEKKDKWKIRF